MSRLRKELGEEDHVLGPADAPVKMIEYGDYECPFCGRAQAEVVKVLNAVGDNLRYAFRHFPLTQIHPHALMAAEAAEAAGAQGRFWEMHQTLFANQRVLEREALIAYADELGLDLKIFVRDLDGHVYAPRIRRDFMSGVRGGVNGTPTFFLNGYRYDGMFNADALIAALTGAGAREAPDAGSLG